MTRATTKKGTKVWLSFVPDCEYNTGGWYVEIYRNQYGDRYDDFCIHTDDCDCQDEEAVERYAKDFVSQIIDY